MDFTFEGRRFRVQPFDERHNAIPPEQLIEVVLALVQVETAPGVYEPLMVRDADNKVLLMDGLNDTPRILRIVWNVLNLNLQTHTIPTSQREQ